MHSFYTLIFALFSYFFLDLELLHLFTGFAPLNPLLTFISCLAVPICHVLLSGSCFFFSLMTTPLRSFSFLLLQYFLASTGVMFVCGVLKLTVARARPHLYLEEGIAGFYFGQVGNDFRSFPSSHVAISVAIALVLLPYLSPRVKPLVFISLFFIAFSRLALQKHFISDVLVGAWIGYMVAYATLALTNKYEPMINQLLGDAL